MVSRVIALGMSIEPVQSSARDSETYAGDTVAFPGVSESSETSVAIEAVARETRAVSEPSEAMDTSAVGDPSWPGETSAACESATQEL